jgi:hypothetical protein
MKKQLMAALLVLTLIAVPTPQASSAIDAPPEAAEGTPVELRLENVEMDSTLLEPDSASRMLEATALLQLDDGSYEGSLGVGGTREFLFLNRFTPDTGLFPFDLNEIWAGFPSATGVEVGDDVDLVVYEDADGNPANGATFRARYSVTILALDAWNAYGLTTPLTMAGPGDVLIGVIARETPGSDYFPAALDGTLSQQRSWVGMWSTSPPPNPPNLPADYSFGLVDSFGYPGNWLVRGYGETLGSSPVLSWPADTNYEQDGLHPESGDEADDYVYRIKYSNAGGDPPGYVRVHIRRGGADISGSPFTMTCDGGDYESGVICTHTQRGLEPATDYTYYFVAQDDQGDPATPPQERNAPDVTGAHKIYLPLLIQSFSRPLAPVLDPIPNPDGHYSYTVNWSSVSDATGYTLQEDHDCSFSSSVVVYSGPGTSWQAASQPVGTYCYRVRSTIASASSEWSNVEWTVVTQPAPLSAPVLDEIDNPNGADSYTISWSSVSGATQYVLEEDDSDSFSSPEEIYAGEETEKAVSGKDEGTYCYRVKATNAFTESPWSDPVVCTTVEDNAVVPRPGYWSGGSVSFKVSSDSSTVEWFELDVYVSGCGWYTLRWTDMPITDGKFSKGTFTTETSASGSCSYFFQACNGWVLGTSSWSATWDRY